MGITIFGECLGTSLLALSKKCVALLRKETDG